MAAPSPQETRPHHVKGEVCTNRPRYREGRKPKAVKVYTVNQESKYLMVQGVPTVGAQHELIRLFALYGAVEEYRLLDEYPAEEFTEVYWIKYSKLQAARYAKRKLDDHSFFGGNLHVCYAPEFETVKETRAKLQERRKEVSKRTRYLGNSTASTPTSSSSQSDGNPSTSTLLPSDGDKQNYQITEAGNRHQERERVSVHITNTPPPPPPQSAWSGPRYQHHSLIQSNFPQQTFPNPSYNQEHQVYPPFPPPSLPLPPHPMPPGSYEPPQRNQTDWGHAKVPSAHATLPKQLQTVSGSLHELNDHSHQKQSKETHLASVPSDSSQQGQTTNSKYNTFHSHQTVFSNKGNLKQDSLLSNNESRQIQPISDTPSPGEQPTLSRNILTPGTVIIKDFKYKGAKPRFVPRQITKPTTTNKVKLEKSADDLNEQIKQNAFILGQKSGPALPPSEQKQHEEDRKKAETDATIENTRSKIREKLKAFSTVDPSPVIKKKKTS